MSRGINKVILIGNLGGDPEIKHLSNGDAVATVTLATSESWKDKTTGEQVDKTEWHRVVFFRKLAEVAGQYLKKGSKIYIEGKLKTDKYDKNGVETYSTKIIANQLQMLDGKPDSQHDTAPQQSDKQPAQQTTQTAGKDDFDDDIPF